MIFCYNEQNVLNGGQRATQQKEHRFSKQHALLMWPEDVKCKSSASSVIHDGKGKPPPHSWCAPLTLICCHRVQQTLFSCCSHCNKATTAGSPPTAPTYYDWMCECCMSGLHSHTYGFILYIQWTPLPKKKEEKSKDKK